jgi:Fic family protein
VNRTEFSSESLHRRFGLKHNTANQTLSEPAVLGFAQQFMERFAIQSQKK